MQKLTIFNQKSNFIKFFYLILFLLGGFFVSSALAQLVTINIFSEPFSATNSMSANQIRIIQSITAVGTWLLPALLFSYFATTNFFSYTKIQNRTTFSSIIIVIVLAFFLLPIVLLLAHWNEMIALPKSWYFVEQWLRSTREQSEQLLNILLQDQRWEILLLNIVVLAIIPALCEEFFFRGTLQPFLSKWLKNNYWGIVLTAFIFSTLHFDFYGFFPRFLLGIYLGILLLWSNSLWLSILAHFCHNTFSVLAQFIANRQQIDPETISIENYQTLLILFIVSLIIFAFGLFLLKKITKHKISASIPHNSQQK